VEDTETLGVLTEIGVNYVQGYGIAMPVPMDAVVKRRS
jgi:EAL domain-containing protein (putative c-di-GMP-specific phosphodiesterase class I)